MSTQVSTAFSQQYSSNVQLLLQQMDNPLEMAVETSSAVGKNVVVVEQVGAVNAVRRTTRHADTPIVDTPHAKRWAAPFDYEVADLIDDQDKVRMLVELTSPYARNHAAAMARACTDEIVAAFSGTAMTGENGTTPQAANTAEVVDTSGLTFVKLRAALLNLMAAEVDLDSDPLFCAIRATQHDELLNITNGTNLITQSTDFNSTPVLVDGRIHRFMGINFIHTQRLLDDANGDRLIPVWAKSGMHLVNFGSMKNEVTVRPDKSYSTQVYSGRTIGATRTEENKVVLIACQD